MIILLAKKQASNDIVSEKTNSRLFLFFYKNQTLKKSFLSNQNVTIDVHELKAHCEKVKVRRQKRGLPKQVHGARDMHSHA